MKYSPIILNDESVRGILDDRKTQHRQVIKPQLSDYWPADSSGSVAQWRREFYYAR